MKETIRNLWARTKISLWPGEYLLVSLPHQSLIDSMSVVSSAPGYFSAIVVERDEVSLTVEKDLWKARAGAVRFHAAEGPFRVVTLELNLDLQTVGYLAPAAIRLAEAGISIIPQCAFLKDHLLVRASDAERTRMILEDLARECQAGAEK